MNTTLLNFRAPDRIKDDFMEVCKLNCTTMTSELVKSMLEFISEGNERIRSYETESNKLNNQSTADSTLERHGNLIKDTNGTWVNANDWNAFE